MSANDESVLRSPMRRSCPQTLDERRLHEYGEQLKSLSRRLILAQERERRAIAIELHDEAGQGIASFKLNLDALYRMSTSDEQRDLIRGMMGRLDEYTAKIRQLSLSLRPPMLDDLGIVPTLEWFIGSLQETNHIRVEFIHNDIPSRLPAETGIACFRIVQEALTNVLRHARADSAVVELYHRESRLELGIRDDGTGFDVRTVLDEAMRGRSMGLLGMQERTALAGGTFSIDSSPDAGTEIEAVFPLPPDAITARTNGIRLLNTQAHE